MKIHIAASEQDMDTVRQVVSLVKKAGHEVWDWTCDAPPQEYADEVMPEWSVCIPKYRHLRALARSCADAELIVSVGKGDFEAGRQIGIAYVLNIPVVGVPDLRPEGAFMDHLGNLPGLTRLLKQIYPPSGLCRGGGE